MAHKFERVTLTTDEIKTNYRAYNLTPFNAGGVYVKIVDRRGLAFYSAEPNPSILVCGKCGDEFIHSGYYADSPTVCPCGEPYQNPRAQVQPKPATPIASKPALPIQDIPLCGCGAELGTCDGNSPYCG